MLDIFLPIPCCWPDKREREIRRINSDIDKQIRRDKRESSKQYKILLLGAGESGKSTFIRHMRILHGDGFRLREREEARETVISNLMELDKHCSDSDSARLRHLGSRLGPLLTASEEREVTQHVYELMAEAGCEQQEQGDREGLLREIGDNPRFRSTLESLTLFKLPDSALYFLTQMERLLGPSFTPSSEDMIRMRRATTGIQETVLQFGEVHFRLVDVGGQRSERRKWIHCFEDVSSIIFIASLAEYNLSLVEDSAVNRLEESTALFHTILRNPWLRQSSMILFLNKKDIFDEKIRYFDLRDQFPAFTGSYCDSAEAKDFILDMFITPVKNIRTKIYSHITIATDPDNVQFVFAAVKHTILSSIMEEIFSTGSDHLQ